MAFKLIIIAVLVLGALISGCAPEEKPAIEPEKLILGVETSLLPSTVWIAENKGYFREEGLDVEIREFSSGRNALATMLKEGNPQNLDLVTAAQTPVMFNSFTKDNYAIVATMVSSDKDLKIITRKDTGIQSAADLQGKKVGITQGSTGQYFLGLFLNLADIEYSDVKTVDYEASNLPQALADSQVDAISTWEPHIYNAKKLLGDQEVLLSKEEIFREEFYFISNKDFLQDNPDTVKKFLRAVEKGAIFIQRNKTGAIDIVSQRLNLDKEFTTAVWDDFVFKISLDQSLLATLEDEARWAMANNFVKATEIPNYLDYVYIDALDEIKPEAVTMAHKRQQN